MAGGGQDNADEGIAFELPGLLGRHRTSIVVVDMVESVRRMRRDEDAVIAHWDHFTRRVCDAVLPLFGGSLVKSLGDGMMLTFEEPQQAVRAAQRLHEVNADLNRAARPGSEPIALRVGIHYGDVVTGKLDIYGHSANLAARIATLGGPDETVVSAEVRDNLVAGLDCEVEDLGECYLKHIDEPVRVYRVGGAGGAPVLPAVREQEAAMQPTIAVIPFEARSKAQEHYAVGELIADGVISRLSRTAGLRVISRLSTTAFRGRDTSAGEVRARLGAGYVLTGGYAANGERLLVTAELASATGDVIWSEQLGGEVADLLQPDSEFCNRIAQACHRAVFDAEVDAAATRPLPSLRGYTLLLGGVTLMHRATTRDFLRARELLDRVAELHGRNAQPLAWLGKWYVLKVAQGWSERPERDAAEALSCCRRALDFDGNSSLAVAITGQVHGYLRQDLDAAERLYREALAINPSESLAWLWLGMSAAFRGEGQQAAEAAEKALALSPLDPLKYYYQSLAASASICAGRYERAIELARDSIRVNRTHSSTYRALAIAHALAGQMEEAGQAVQQLLNLEPQFTVRSFLARYPGRDLAGEYVNKLADALAAAGLPK